MRIRIDTEQAREIGRWMVSQAEHLEDVGRRVVAAAEDAEWESHGKLRLQDELAAVRSRCETRAQEMRDMGQRMVQIADRFEEADNKSAEAVAAIDWSVLEGAYIAAAAAATYTAPTSVERVENLESILDHFDSTRHLAEWLRSQGIQVEFGNTDANVLGYCTKDGKKIVLSKNIAGWSDIEIAAVLVHEATHSRDSKPFGLPIVDDMYNFMDDIFYAVYPYPEEYRAFRAEADFWREVGAAAPSNPTLDAVVDLIYTPEGNYRDVDAVYRDLRSLYGY